MIYLDDSFELTQLKYNGCREIEFLVNETLKFVLFIKNNKQQGTTRYMINNDEPLTVGIDSDIFITKVAGEPKLFDKYEAAIPYNFEPQKYVAVQKCNEHKLDANPEYLSDKIYFMVDYFDSISSVKQFGNDVKISYTKWDMRERKTVNTFSVIRGIKGGYVYYTYLEKGVYQTRLWAVNYLRPKSGVVYNSIKSSIYLDTEENLLCNITIEKDIQFTLDDTESIVIKAPITSTETFKFQYNNLFMSNIDCVKLLKDRRSKKYEIIEIFAGDKIMAKIVLNAPYKYYWLEYFGLEYNKHSKTLHLYKDHGIDLLRYH